MTQGKLTTSGDIEFQPTSWDGEPLYSTATVQEGLFSADAFEQMRGQISMADRCDCGEWLDGSGRCGNGCDCALNIDEFADNPEGEFDADGYELRS